MTRIYQAFSEVKVRGVWPLNNKHSSSDDVVLPIVASNLTSSTLKFKHEAKPAVVS